MANYVKSTEMEVNTEDSSSSPEPANATSLENTSETPPSSAEEIEHEESISRLPHISQAFFDRTLGISNSVSGDTSTSLTGDSDDSSLMTHPRGSVGPTETTNLFTGIAEQMPLQDFEPNLSYSSASLFEQTFTQQASSSPSRSSMSTLALRGYESNSRRERRVAGVTNRSRMNIRLPGGTRPSRIIRERRRFPLLELNPLSVPLPLYQGGGGPRGSVIQGIPQYFDNWRRNQRQSANRMRTSANSSSIPMDSPPRRATRHSRNSSRLSSISDAEIDRLFSQIPASAPAPNHPSYPLSARNSTPCAASNFDSHDYPHRLRFIYVGTATDETVAGRQVWATRHRNDPFNLEYWVDDPARPLREVILLSNNPGFRWQEHNTVEFESINLAPHLQFMSEEQVIDWLSRLLRMRYGVNDNWFLFQ